MGYERAHYGSVRIAVSVPSYLRERYDKQLGMSTLCCMLQSRSFSSLPQFNILQFPGHVKRTCYG
jgi:hypothetical protein